ISFGGTQAANVQCTTTQCTATIPTGTSIVDVVVSVGGLNSVKTPVDLFSYIPVITTVTPNHGPRTGGNSVTITGAGFTSTQFIVNPTGINFGPNPGVPLSCTP